MILTIYIIYVAIFHIKKVGEAWKNFSQYSKNIFKAKVSK